MCDDMIDLKKRRTFGRKNLSMINAHTPEDSAVNHIFPMLIAVMSVRHLYVTS